MSAAEQTQAKIDPSIDHLAVPIDQLEHWPGNPRRGNVPAVAASLQANGQYKPIIRQARTDDGRAPGPVFVGNHTLEAARDVLAWDRIAVIEQDVDDATARRIMLADNRTSDLGTYDTGLLVDEIRRLPDLDGSGYDQLALEGLLKEVAAVSPQGSGAPPPDSFGVVDPDAMTTEHRCPQCGYEWSGNAS